jgi:hypothetical protein
MTDRPYATRVEIVPVEFRNREGKLISARVPVEIHDQQRITVRVPIGPPKTETITVRVKVEPVDR